jgi:hypothetical protein
VVLPNPRELADQRTFFIRLERQYGAATNAAPFEGHALGKVLYVSPAGREFGRDAAPWVTVLFFVRPEGWAG